MYWIELCPEWLTVTGGSYGHTSRRLDRWTVDMTPEETLDFKYFVESSNFGSISLDHNGRLTTLVVTPTVTQIEPEEGSAIPSMRKRLEEMIAHFFGE